MLSSLFITNPAPELLVNGAYDYTLVVVSVIVAIIASFFTLIQIDFAEKNQTSSISRLAKLGGAVAMAGGIWSMHFIGMLAFSLCVEISYDPWLTGASVIPALIACWSAFEVITKPSPTLTQKGGAALILGAGIGVMHYAGMEAMQLGPSLKYDPGIFSLSIVVAVSLAFVAIQFRAKLRRVSEQYNQNAVRLLCAVILGAAVSGMHYTGMAAARFVADSPIIDQQIQSQHNQSLALFVAAMSIIISALSALVHTASKYRAVASDKAANESRLEAIFETAVDGIITIDSQANIQSCNAVVSDILGYQETELLGQNIAILLPQHSGVRGPLSSAEIKQFSAVGSEITTQHKNGTLVPVRLGVGEVKLKNQASFFVAFITDLTVQKQMQQALKEQEARHRTLLNNMPGVAFRCKIDEQWSMSFVSPIVAELTGYRSEEFIANTITFEALLHHEDKTYVRDVIDEALQSGKGSYSLEYRIKHRAGEIKWVLDKGSFEFDEQGKVAGIAGVLLDISERKSMEDELRTAKRIAESAAASKQAFLANMSHEIRTPMNAILGFSEVLKDSPLQPEQSKHVHTILTSAKALLHLLNDILDSAKLEQGKLDLVEADFCVSELVDNVVSTFWYQAKKKGLALELEISPNLHQYYHGAPDRLRQILVNLLGNAIKFTNQGCVKLCVRADGDKGLLFEIHDTGIGIEKNRLEAIFNPFEQADGSMSRNYGGTGLGTTISRQLVELMQGEIWAQSEVDKGSTFSFTVPLKQIATLTNSNNYQQVELPPLSILVADDIQQNTELLQLLLSKHGHTIDVAHDGEEALSKVKAGDYDVILMDIHMPGCDGLEATRKIKAWQQQTSSKATPIIALTASVLGEDRAAAKQAGMVAFASKPLVLEELTRTIAKVLGLKVPEQSQQEREAITKQLINRARAINLWGDEPRFLAELSRFWQGKRADVIALMSHETPLDAAALESVHTLKGIAGNLALETLADSLSQAERSKCLDERLRAKLANIVEQLDDVVGVSDENTVTAALTQGDAEQFKHSLSRIKAMVLAAQVEDEVIVALRESAPPSYHRDIELLQHALDDFDFQRAEQIVAQLMGSES